MGSALTDPYTPPACDAPSEQRSTVGSRRSGVLRTIALGQAQAGLAGKGGEHDAYQQIPNKTTQDHKHTKIAKINHSGAVINHTSYM